MLIYFIHYFYIAYTTNPSGRKQRGTEEPIDASERGE